MGPKPDLTNRIISNYFPDKTYTGTSFDDPKRKDVVQTDLPTQTTRTFEETIDPKGKAKKPVQTVSGTIYHGTGSTDPNVVFGSKFIESNSKELNRRSRYSSLEDKKKKKKREDADKKKKKKREDEDEDEDKKKKKKREDSDKKKKKKREDEDEDEDEDKKKKKKMEESEDADKKKKKKERRRR